MHTADAVLAGNGRELGFGIEWQIDDLVLDVPALQVLPVVVHGGQQFAGMDRSVHLLASKGLADEDAGIPPARELQHGVNASRGAPVLAEELEIAAIGLGDEDLSTHIRRLASLLDLDGLRQDLVLLAGAQKQSGALERRRRQGGDAEGLVLALEDLGHRRQRLLGEVAQVDGRGIAEAGGGQYDLAIGGGHVAVEEREQLAARQLHIK